MEISNDEACGNYCGICAICLDKIMLQETALVKGCEHAYCVTCILRWASYTQNNNNPSTCPQCKNQFEFLNIHRSLDGSIQDFMFEESVCLLLRAAWFQPLQVVVEDHEDVVLPYDEDEYEVVEEEEVYFGNRRWGDHKGYFQDCGVGSSSSEPKKKVASKNGTGRQAER